MLQILLQYFCGTGQATEFSLSKFMSFPFKLSIPLYVFCNTLSNAVLHLTTHSHWNQLPKQLPALPGPICEEFPAISCKTSFILTSENFSLIVIDWKTEKHLWEVWLPQWCLCQWLVVVSLWFHTCLSAAVISALKLIIWSGEQLLQYAENLEQRGQMVTIELLFK